MSFCADAEVGRQDTGKKRTKLVVNDPHSGDSLTNPYIPFSAGPRDCLGQRMGMMEVRQSWPEYQCTVKIEAQNAPSTNTSQDDHWLIEERIGAAALATNLCARRLLQQLVALVLPACLIGAELLS